MFEIIDISKLKNCIVNEFDLFICFNSFEKRCFSIASHIPTELFHNFLIFTNKIQLENEKENLQQILDILPDRTVTVSVDLSNPILFADELTEKLNGIHENTPLKRIFVDITTFTHETLLILLALIRQKYNNAEIICGYNNASVYSYNVENPQEKWLSRGIGNVRSVLGYSGEIKPSLDNLLVVIVGYEYERAARIIDEISPDCLSIGYNSKNSSSTDRDKDANENYARLLKNMAAYYDETLNFEVPSNDPIKAYEAICKQLDMIGKDKNITIVPMNNKLSTLGVALVGLKRPKIQVCYAPALVYNTSFYSCPGDKCYLFSFDV